MAQSEQGKIAELGPPLETLWTWGALLIDWLGRERDPIMTTRKIELMALTTGNSRSPKLRRLPFLDALRGLAAAYVVVYHMILIPNPNLGVPGWAYKVAHAGGTGVMLFFVVSAFSLYYTMPLRFKERYPTLNFYFHRFFRIAPLFYVWIFLSIVRDAWYFPAHHSYLSIAAGVTFLFNLIPHGQESFVWASWTIGVEMLFYAVFPIMYRHVRDVWIAFAVLFLLILAWMFIETILPLFLSAASLKSYETWSFMRFLPVFSIGAMVYFVIDGILKREQMGRCKSVGLLLVAAAVYAYLALLDSQIRGGFADARIWQGLIYGALVVGLCLNPLRLFVNRFTTYLGKISYSLYLGHTTVVLFLTPVYHYIYAHLNQTSSSFVLSYMLTLGLAIALADVTYRFVEVPGIQLGKFAFRWVSAKLSSRSSESASVA